jgi:excisionase family DNA binding protein
MQLMGQGLAEELNKNVSQLLDAFKRSADKPMNLKMAAEYLGVDERFMYKLNNRREIPFSKPGGKIVFYWKSKLDAWINKNRVASQEELERDDSLSE